jgi:Zn-dependent protease with chaperone function
VKIMGLRAASGVALTALFGLMYALMFIIVTFSGITGMIGLILIIGLTLLIVFFQYLIGPVIIKWIYKIDWMPFDVYKAQFPHLGDAINKVCQLRGVKIPRVGIIHDLNPNAFTFGYTKNKARVVITDGIIEHLNENEQAAVVAHEMGHVVHNDFILMTVVFAIPLVLLTIARWAYYTAIFSGMSRSSDDEGSQLALALFAVAVLSYITYYIGFLISLIVSRVREYYADEHAGEVLENPNYLSTGLVKIAYGLVSEGGYTEADRKRRNKSNVRGLRGMGIFDPSTANITASTSVGGSGKFSKDAIQAAAAWDLFNPWAKYFQMFSTHPVPAKRILRLNDQCTLYGVEPELDFSKARKIKEEQAGKSMIPEFITDVFVSKLATFVLVIWGILTLLVILGMVGLLPIFNWVGFNFLLFWAFGFVLMGIGNIIGTLFMYKKGFEDKTVLDLVTYVKASPVRCIPSKIRGRIIGRGIPGYYFGEDLYFQDETGIMYIDYRFGLGIVDFFFGILKAKKLVGQEVKIEGWYRRGPAPYLQVRYIQTADGKRYKNHSRGLTFFWAILMFIIAAVLFWLFIIYPM